MKDVKKALKALSEIYLRLRFLSRDGMKPEQAACLDKAQKAAKDALGEDVVVADGMAVYYTPQAIAGDFLKRIADEYGIKIGDEPSRFEKFMTVAPGVTLVRFHGRDEIRLVARRVGNSGNPNTIFEILIDKALKHATAFRDGRILFELQGVTVGYSKVEAMAVSALKRWFRDQRKRNAQRRRKRKARLAAAEAAKEA